MLELENDSTVLSIALVRVSRALLSLRGLFYRALLACIPEPRAPVTIDE